MAAKTNSVKCNIKKESYECFDVFKDNCYHTLIHVSIDKKEIFYKNMFENFFTDEKLLRYADHKSNLHFEPTEENYCTLYRHLLTYLDEENISKEVSELCLIVKEVLIDENEVEEKNGKLYVRKDKIGKIGEYIFSCILYDYYKFDCIIPKILLLTDPNMNVYGIDTLFYSSKDNLIMFGESKFSKNIENGIKLIKESLKEYEKQIKDEYSLVLCNRLYQDKLYKFNDIYGKKASVSLSIESFIEKAQINKIGVPIFIAHGTEINSEEIFHKLQTIKIGKILNIDVSPIVISLPVICKREFVTYFTQFIRERLDIYEKRAE